MKQIAQVSLIYYIAYTGCEHKNLQKEKRVQFKNKTNNFSFKTQNLTNGVIGQHVRLIVAMEKPLEPEAVHPHAPTLMPMTQITIGLKPVPAIIIVSDLSRYF